MAHQFDFLQISVRDDGPHVRLYQDNRWIAASKDQLPDLIRALQHIHAQHETKVSKANIQRLKAEIRPVDGGPKDAA